MDTRSGAEAGDRIAIMELIERIEGDLARLRALVTPSDAEAPGPECKTCDGKLTSKGVEQCYRLFEDGHSRQSVARTMRISLATATRWFRVWRGRASEKSRSPRLG